MTDLERIAAALERLVSAAEKYVAAVENRATDDAYRLISERRKANEVRVPPVVYFATRGEPKDGALIKIGYTRNLASRMRDLDAVVLATEPGGREREAELHAAFRHLRHHGEWFTPDTELLAYRAVQRAVPQRFVRRAVGW